MCGTLFGSTSILALTKGEVAICAVMSVVIGAFLVLYNRLFAVTFDESFAAAVGIDVDRYNLLIAVLVALVISVVCALVGMIVPQLRRPKGHRHTTPWREGVHRDWRGLLNHAGVAHAPHVLEDIHRQRAVAIMHHPFGKPLGAASEGRVDPGGV